MTIPASGLVIPKFTFSLSWLNKSERTKERIKVKLVIEPEAREQPEILFWESTIWISRLASSLYRLVYALIIGAGFAFMQKT